MHNPETDWQVGWDVGGAHLKAALVDGNGSAVRVIQLACPIWRGLGELQRAIDQALDALKLRSPCRHFVTMTGELADIFPDRKQGVMQIAETMHQRLGEDMAVYAGSAGLVDMTQIAGYAATIASANWLASASFVASKTQQALFMDIGSTTTDLVLICDGQPQPHGFSDARRMQHEELVYTGVIRTPLMALASRVPFAGEWHGLAAEHFATAADVYRLTGDLSPTEDMADTADGAGKTSEASARRLARMIGYDVQDAPNTSWIELARAFKQLQLIALKLAVMRSLSRNLLDDHAPMVGAGAGSFLVRELARQLGREYIEISDLITAETPLAKHWASVCFPAYAVARLGIQLSLGSQRVLGGTA